MYIDIFSDYVNYVQKTVGILLIVIVLLSFFLYIMYALFLNKLNNVMYGKGTIMAWLPIFNIYLLGKLAFNRLIGLLLIILSIFCVSGEVTIMDKTYNLSIFPANITKIIAIVYVIFVIALYIYAHFKYKRLKLNMNDLINLNNDDNVDNNNETNDNLNEDSFYNNYESNNQFVNNNLDSNSKSSDESNNALDNKAMFVPITQDDIEKSTSTGIDINSNTDSNKDEDYQKNNDGFDLQTSLSSIKLVDNVSNNSTVDENNEINNNEEIKAGNGEVENENKESIIPDEVLVPDIDGDLLKKKEVNKNDDSDIEML